MKGHYNVLFLCTGNSARSIMAEAILNFKGRPNFTAYSAGSHPSGTVRPEALRQLEMAHLPTQGLRSKAWDEFSLPSSPKLDFVFTVCDNAAQEVCPVWPGQPMTAHWGVPDPAAVRGSEAEVQRSFRDAFFTPVSYTHLLTREFLAEMSQLEKRRASLDSEETVPPNRLAFDKEIRRFVERRLRDARSVVRRIKSSAGLRLK